MKIHSYAVAVGFGALMLAGPVLPGAGATVASHPSPKKIVVHDGSGDVTIYANGGAGAPASKQDDIRTATVIRSSKRVTVEFKAHAFAGKVGAKTVYQFIAYLEQGSLKHYYYLSVFAGGSNTYLGGPTGSAKKRHGLWETATMSYIKPGATTPTPVSCPGLIARADNKNRQWIESAPRSCFKHLNFRYNLSGQQRRQVYVKAGGSDTYYDDFCDASECLT